MTAVYQSTPNHLGEPETSWKEDYQYFLSDGQFNAQSNSTQPISNGTTTQRDSVPRIKTETSWDQSMKMNGNASLSETLGNKLTVGEASPTSAILLSSELGEGEGSLHERPGDDQGLDRVREGVRIQDAQFYPEPTAQVNPFYRLSHPHSGISPPLLPMALSQGPTEHLDLNGGSRQQNLDVGHGDAYTSGNRAYVAPTVHIKRVGKDMVELVAHSPNMDILAKERGDRTLDVNSDALNGHIADEEQTDGEGQRGSRKTNSGNGKKKGLMGRVFGRNKETSQGVPLESAPGRDPSPSPQREFISAEAQDQFHTTPGSAPPSPPMSDSDGEFPVEEDDDSTSADSESEEETDPSPLFLSSQVFLGRPISISGGSFTQEPESFERDTAPESPSGTAQMPKSDSAGSVNAGSVGSARVFPSERTSLDRPSSTNTYPNLGPRSGALRTGAIAASKGRTSGMSGASGSSTLAPGASPVSRGTSPSQRQVDQTLDAREPIIPSTAEQAPHSSGSTPVPEASAGQPTPTAQQHGHQAGSTGYFPQPPGSLGDPSLLQGGAYLHPSSASFMSTLSVGSSSQQHAGPSTQPIPLPYRAERRNTSSSLAASTMHNPTGPRSPLLKAYTHIGAPPSWDQTSALSASSLRKANQTEVPGLQGSALDPDILAEAEKLRRERLSKRQRKRSSSGGGLTAESASNGDHANQSTGIYQNGVDDVGHSVNGIQSNRQSALQPNELPNKVVPQGDTGPLVGNLIGEDHVNYVLMYNMLTGIRIGVSRCQAKMKRPVTDADFTAKHKYSFDIIGNELTPSARYDFKFKDYAPWVFRELREEYFHLDPADYLLSLTAKYILSELGSPGKSGSFFYFSRDYRFIIKTIHHAEHKYLRSILKGYYEHIKSNPHTLLSRFYGLHRVKLPRGRKIHFVIMNNLFPPHRDIHETYDLKGSALGREYPEEKAKLNPKATMKDLNWVHRGRIFELGPEKRALFGEQVRRDRDFLKHIGVMDYSLLIGIHNMERGNRDNLRENQLSVFQPNMNNLVKRKPSSVKGGSDAAAMRKAVRRSDPKALTSAVAELPTSDSADRRHFLFYQDEGGLRATDEANEAMDIIYYLGVIDILTPYNLTKKLEHLWRSLTVQDRHMVSCVPPDEYGDRFLAFLVSFFRGADVSQRPRMELKTKTE